MKSNKISIIIINNDSSFLEECLKSILNQTYDNYEILLACNSDNKEKLKKISNKIKIYDINSSNSAYIKNYCLEKATGEYIIFLNSCDTLENVTLEVCLNKFKEENPDFIFFDWKYYNPKKDIYHYDSIEKFFYKRNLYSKDISNLLDTKSYDIMCKMYKTSFLKENNIKYNEKCPLSETLFWVNVVVNAKKVALIHSPLYNLKEKDNKYNIDDFILTYEMSSNIFKEKDKIYKSKFNKHILDNFYLFYKNTFVFKRIKSKRKFLNILKSNFPLEIENNKKVHRLTVKYNSIKNMNSLNFYLLINFLNDALSNIIKILKNIKRFFFKSLNTKIYNKYKNKPLKNQILLVGFSFKYTGNNRYLFEELIKQNNDFDIYYAVNSDIVLDKYKVKPLSEEFYEILYSSKVVIFESWIQNSFIKNDKSVWINLWHGTPLKKMFFDSEEYEITKNNPKHKIKKYKTPVRMDYLVTDNKNINKYFETSFLLPKEKILPLGYPRVKYLIDNKNNEELKKKIRKELDVKDNKKIVTYLPTWRDYNFEKGEYDFGYLLDKEKLSNLLGDDYVIKSKDHRYLSKTIDLNNTNIETQELLLVTDYLITDYSSVMFDAFPIDVPVCIYANDFEKYEKSRGVYKEMWDDLEFCTTKTLEQVADFIKNYEIDEKYNAIKEKYCYNSNGNCLIEFIKSNLK